MSNHTNSRVRAGPPFPARRLAFAHALHSMLCGARRQNVVDCPSVAGQSGESSGDDSDHDQRAGGDDDGVTAADIAQPAGGREDWMTKPMARSMEAPPDTGDDEATAPKTTVSALPG